MHTHHSAHAETGGPTPGSGLHPLRFNVNRVVADRVLTRIERYRTIMPDPREWRNYAVAQIAAALDAAGSSKRTTDKGESNVITR